MIIEIDFIPPSLNVWQRMNRFKRSAINKKLVFLIFHQWIKDPKKFKKVLVEYYRPGNLDADNLAASFKPIGDALVKCGIIPDDSPEFLKLKSYNSKDKKVKVVIKKG